MGQNFNEVRKVEEEGKTGKASSQIEEIGFVYRPVNLTIADEGAEEKCIEKLEQVPFFSW